MLWSGRSSRVFCADGNEAPCRVAGKRSTESSGRRDSADCKDIPTKDVSMNHCVPDWDLEDGIIPSSDFLPMAKGNWEAVQQKKPMLLDNEIVELLWENGQVVTQSQTNRAIKRALPAHLSKSMQNDDAVLPGKPYTAVKDNILESVVHDVAAPNASSMHEDEMASFLHYPLDDTLEKEYCSDFFGGMPNSNVHILRDSLGGQMNSFPAEKASSAQALKEPPLLNDSSSVPRTGPFVNMINATNAVSSGKMSKEPTSKLVSVDKAPSLGADKATGLIPPSADTFAKVKTTSQSLASKCCNNAQPSRDLIGDQSACKKNTTQVSVPPLAMPPPKMQANGLIAVKPGTPRLVNFSHFSRPTATVKANLQSRGSTSALSTTERLNRSDKVAVDGNASAEPSMIASTASDMTTIESNNCVNSQVQALGCCQRHQNPFSRKDLDPATCSEDVTDSSAKEQVVCQNSDVTRSLGPRVIEKYGDAGDIPEPTVTSSSGGSGNSAGRTGKEATDSSKRKGRDAESSECQSEDAEYESVDRKKQAPSRTTTAKRSRAAEVHNQSERRRRDRINERMRALQELIPHCNKSDKASMLDEAIEYLKTLKLQVQIMSMGGGMGIPPVFFPGGMQHFQIPQMAHLSPMGMGMGFSMGMVDRGTASGQPVLPFPSVLGSSLPGSTICGPTGLPMSGMVGSGLQMPRVRGSALQVSGRPVSALSITGLPGPVLPGAAQPLLGSTSTSRSTDLQTPMQNSNLMGSYKPYLNHQKIQMSPQAMNVSLCNTPMIQQHQNAAQTKGMGVQNAASGPGSTGNSG